MVCREFAARLCALALEREGTEHGGDDILKMRPVQG